MCGMEWPADSCGQVRRNLSLSQVYSDFVVLASQNPGLQIGITCLYVTCFRAANRIRPQTAGLIGKSFPGPA